MYTIVKCRYTLEISFFLYKLLNTLNSSFYIVVIERQHYILNVIVSQHTFVSRFLKYCCFWNYQT